MGVLQQWRNGICMLRTLNLCCSNTVLLQWRHSLFFLYVFCYWWIAFTSCLSSVFISWPGML